MPEANRKARWRSRMIRSVLIAIGLLLVPYALSRLLSPWRTVTRHEIPVPNPAPPATSNVLRIASYNIAHGRGNGAASENWTGESRVQRLNRLRDIAAVIRSMDADAVVLNEVDFDSSWSHGLNQARELATMSGYQHWVEQRNLDFRVLFWKWRFGNAILSKYPITNADVIDLPGYAKLETVLAGKKRGVACDIQWNDQLIRVASVHLSHRSEHLRVKSAERLSAMATNTSIPFFVVGDLNSTPPGFPGSMTNAENRNAIAVLDESGQFRRVPASVPDKKGMTFHSLNPQRVIDWILIPQDWEFQSYEVTLSDLSDHRPLLVTVLPTSEPVTPR